ncbi:MAG: anti-sigma factor antagonist [Deltaproteobacteria bacterium]|nr:anti-sigma factor antagonist [Deltaproteobacteria bacterium]
MASNFTIRFQRKNGDLHIGLKGDFDGSSAHVLLNAIGRNIEETQRILVDTSGLRRVSPFGRDVLHANLSVLKLRLGKIIFIGKHEAAFAA